MRTAYATFAAFRNDVNHVESGGSVPSDDAVLSWNVIESCPPARYGSPTVSSVRSAAAGNGAPIGWPRTVTTETGSPGPSFRTLRPGATQMFSVGNAGATTLLGVPVPFRFAADTRY